MSQEEWKNLQVGTRTRIWYLTDYVYGVVTDRREIDGRVFLRIGMINDSEETRWFDEEGDAVVWSSR